MNLVTGKKSDAHVSSDDFRKIVESLVGGGGSYVSSVGTGLQTSVSGTTLSIGKGVIIHHGCVFETSNSGDTVSFQAGSSGMNRIDLICVKYTRNISTGIEDAAWDVLQGTSTSGTPVQPAVPSGDLRDDNAAQDYCPVFKLTLTGNAPTVQLLLNTIPINDAYNVPSSGIPKTDLSNAVQASLNKADSSVQIDLLWNNETQTSSFSEQTINVNGSGYDSYLIEFKSAVYNGQYQSYLYTMFPVGKGSQMICCFPGDASVLEVDKRLITSSTTSSISFGNAYYYVLDSSGYESDVYNISCIPNNIYGVKGVS